MYKNHVRHVLEELYGIIKGYRPKGIAEPHFNFAMTQLDELKRKAYLYDKHKDDIELAEAVKWAIEEYEDFRVNTTEDGTIWIFPLYPDEPTELLEAYRQSEENDDV